MSRAVFAKCEATAAPCPQCPWRVANHGKRTPGGFHTKRNRTRLWNQIRKGGAPQGCHLTDPSHPDHIAAGAKEDSTPRECLGSVALVVRELEFMKTLAPGDTITPEHVDAYLAVSKERKGLTQSGIAYVLMERQIFGPSIPNPGKWASSEEIGR